jgi:hypothetical protein
MRRSADFVFGIKANRSNLVNRARYSSETMAIVNGQPTPGSLQKIRLRMGREASLRNFRRNLSEAMLRPLRLLLLPRSHTGLKLNR